MYFFGCSLLAALQLWRSRRELGSFHNWWRMSNNGKFTSGEVWRRSWRLIYGWRARVARVGGGYGWRSWIGTHNRSIRIDISSPLLGTGDPEHGAGIDRPMG